MSLTTLTEREWTKIQEILEFRLPTIYRSIFDTKF